MKEKSIDILDLLIVLAKRKKFIIVTTFLVSLFFIVYSLVTAEYWKSNVSFLVIRQGSSPLPISQSLMGGLGATLLGGELPTGAMNHISIMRSRTFSEEIVERFNLIEYFKLQGEEPRVAMELAVKELNEEVVSTGYDLDTGIITVSVETKDRQLSSDIANTYYAKLEQYFLENKMSKGRERRNFLESQIAEFEVNYLRMLNELEDFQRDNRIVDLDAQKESIITLYSEIVAKKIESEIELDYLRKFMSSESQQIISLQEKLSSLNEMIRSFEQGEDDVMPKYIVNIDDIPNITNRFLQLNLNLEIQKMVISFLYPQYEQAKLDELNDISSFELVDGAVPAGLRSKPRRARMVILAFITALIVSSLLAYTYEVFTSPPRKDKIDRFIRELKRLR